MDPGLQGGVIAVAVGLMMALILTGAKKPARTDPKTGNLVLRYHSAIRIIAYVAGIGMCVLIIVLMLVAPFKNPADPFIAAGMLLFFAFLGGYLYLESEVRIELAEDGVSASSPWRRARFLKWDEIEDVRFSASAQWFILTSVTGEKVRVHTMMVGIRDFAEFLRDRISAKKLEGAEAGFKQIDG